MIPRTRCAFIIDKDEFVRLSLSKMLQKYGFQVEEIEEFSQLEGREKDIRGGMVVADVEIGVLEKGLSLLKKWSDRFILISPLVTDELTLRLKKMGIQHIIKKPVDPRILRKVIRTISFPDGVRVPSLGKKRGGFPLPSERRWREMKKWVFLLLALVFVVNLATMGVACKPKAPEKPAAEEAKPAEEKPAEAPAAPAPEKPAEAEKK